MKVKYKEHYSHEAKEMSVENYVSRYQASSYGVAEAAGETAGHTLEVLGRLIETLADKKLLNVEEIDQIVNGTISGCITEY